jgi:hypothetical protein
LTAVFGGKQFATIPPKDGKTNDVYFEKKHNWIGDVSLALGPELGLGEMGPSRCGCSLSTGDDALAFVAWLTRCRVTSMWIAGGTKSCNPRRRRAS